MMRSRKEGLAVPVQRRRRRTDPFAETGADQSQREMSNGFIEIDPHCSAAASSSLLSASGKVPPSSRREVNPKSPRKVPCNNASSAADNRRRSCRRSSSMPVSVEKPSEEALPGLRSRKISERSRLSSLAKRSNSRAEEMAKEEEDFVQERGASKTESPLRTASAPQAVTRMTQDVDFAGSAVGECPRPNKRKLAESLGPNPKTFHFQDPKSNSSEPLSPPIANLSGSSAAHKLTQEPEISSVCVSSGDSVVPLSEANFSDDDSSQAVEYQNPELFQQINSPSPQLSLLQETEETGSGSISEDNQNPQCSSGRNLRNYQPSSEGYDRLSYVGDLIMWKDTSKSALLFGMGAFCVLSSSFTQDLGFSLVSCVCYLALVYLAAVFFYKTILRRGTIEDDADRSSCEIIKERDVLSILRCILPTVNVLLTKLQRLFSGDPVITIKLALALWFFAQCGHRVSLCTLLKLCFIAAFTLPKLYACYSSQLQKYGHFMLNRFWDAWNSCSHKKGVLLTVLLMVWNLSTVSTRIWGAFMLIVALHLYHRTSKEEQDNQDLYHTQGQIIQIPADKSKVTTKF